MIVTLITGASKGLGCAVTRRSLGTKASVLKRGA
jgi:NADP-dependent 3-hydroxy acid dehydrogenase YdfG